MTKNILKIFLLINISIFAQNANLVELSKIRFSGNDYFSDAELYEVVGIKETPNTLSQTLNSIFGIGDEASFFDSLTLHEEVIRLKSFYFNK